MLHRLQQIVLSPFFQGLVIAGLVILFLPLGLKKYAVKEAAMYTNFDKTQYFFSDIDHDGQSERIQTLFNLSGNVGIALVDGIQTLGQWNFRGIYAPGSPRIMNGDYDQDKKDEIYIFTLVQDSIMLHALEYSLRPELFIRDRFIARLGKTLKDPDYLFIPGKLTDMTGDGSGDLVFAITGGHSKQPRNVFIYDILNDSLLVSPKSGAFISTMILDDIDSDSYPEMVLSTYASSNFNELPFEYSDTSSWLMVIDHNLEFMFPPVEFPGPTGGTQVYPVISPSNNKRLFCFATYGSPVIDRKKWFIADIHGNVLKEKNIGADDQLFFIGLMPRPVRLSSDKVLGIKEKEGFFEIDTNMDCHKITTAKFSRWAPDFIDIDLDGDDEIILVKPDHKKHVVYRNDFSHPVELDFPIQSINPIFSVKLNGDDPPQLSVQGDQDWKLFDYGINPAYRLRFLIYLGIYLAILGFILLIRKLYSFQLKKRYENEKKIARLQLSSVKAQMEPHFIMNTINTIGSSIYRQKSEDAYRQLLNFSGMVRSLLVSSDKLTRTLNEETEFVRNYLELEKSRFGELFDYSISQSAGLDPETIVFKMIIQIHAENALKHGLLPKKSGGVLKINIDKEEEYVVISIEDNGIGRNAAARNASGSTGRGMKILGQLFETYNKHNRSQIRQEIIDLYHDDGKASGTRVKIYIPLDFNEGIF